MLIIQVLVLCRVKGTLYQQIKINTMKTKKIEEQVEQVKDLSKNFTHSQIKEATGISSQSLINFTREGKMLGHMSFLKLSKFVGVKSIKL